MSNMPTVEEIDESVRKGELPEQDADLMKNDLQKIKSNRGNRTNHHGKKSSEVKFCAFCSQGVSELAEGKSICMNCGSIFSVQKFKLEVA